MNYRKIFIQTILLLSVSITFTNCADKPTHLELIIKSGKNLNPNKNNIPCPLVLHFYELKDTEQFLKVDFWGLNDEAKTRLENSLILQSKQVIVPNEEQNYKILFDKNTKYFGLVGSFRNIDNNGTWRYIKSLDEGYNNIQLIIDNSSIKEIN
ncbi:MAG: type VI secretion system lipoprotein TssJ [Sulfuricurvum sp.]|nr:type VI secretion system lipoprotein TssJ [Sulfuricurvum sp.]